MKKRLVFFSCLLLGSTVWAQPAADLQATAKSFMRTGDYSNAVLVLNRAVLSDPNNIEIKKDLSMCYYLQKDNAKALEIIKPVLEREDADDQCYQIAGNIYRQLDQAKECEKLYRKGLKKFPESGAMYNELGELLWDQQDYSAIKQWEKGIEIDPNYSKNYYNACKYYYLTADNVWSVLYGETFLNMEPLSGRAPEIKNILLESYKRLFVNTLIKDPSPTKNKFTAAVVETLNKQTGVANEGINAESLTMIRTRFILDWFENYGTQFPSRLFDLQRQLLQEGLFDAYNQWIFGAAQNLGVYQNWTTTHATEYADFTRFQRGRIFKLVAGQYYH